MDGSSRSLWPPLQNGTCIFAGGDEKLNLEAQTLALKTIGCRPFNRIPLHSRVRPGCPCHISLWHAAVSGVPTAVRQRNRPRSQRPACAALVHVM